MHPNELYALRFPIGEFELPEIFDQGIIDSWIQSISDFPSTLIELTANLSTEHKNLTYRPEGWNIKQVVHHCADSHMNAFLRFKFTLTEDTPTIRPYFEDRWAELEDGLDDDLTATLQLLTALHSKWTKIARNLSHDELKRTYFHPANEKEYSLLEAIGLYAWHCDHHLGHVKLALKNIE